MLEYHQWHSTMGECTCYTGYHRKEASVTAWHTQSAPSTGSEDKQRPNTINEKRKFDLKKSID